MRLGSPLGRDLLYASRALIVAEDHAHWLADLKRNDKIAPLEETNFTTKPARFEHGRQARSPPTAALRPGLGPHPWIHRPGSARRRSRDVQHRSGAQMRPPRGPRWCRATRALARLSTRRDDCCGHGRRAVGRHNQGAHAGTGWGHDWAVAGLRSQTLRDCV